MKKNARIVSFSLLAACLFLPTVASSEKPAKGKGGGKAMDHRSEQGAERSNAQWLEDATRGPDRANEGGNRNDDIDEPAKARNKGEKKHDKKHDKKHADDAKGDKDSKSNSDREGQRDRGEGDRADDERAQATDTQEDAKERREGTEKRGFWQRTFGGGDPEDD